MKGPATRKVKMIAPTYLKGVVADIGSEHVVPSATAAEFVANGRAIYTGEVLHTDAKSPPSTVLDVETAAPLVPTNVKGDASTLGLNRKHAS